MVKTLPTLDNSDAHLLYHAFLQANGQMYINNLFVTRTSIFENILISCHFPGKKKPLPMKTKAT